MENIQICDISEEKSEHNIDCEKNIKEALSNVVDLDIR